MAGAERTRVEGFGQLENGLRDAGDWYRWGPYLSERQWGTVREDYSADGDAWSYFPHDHARSRAYRWGEDGMAGFCDVEQRLCLSLALWNGQDPILKERMFGLTGAQANHGEDVKEYWWYLDAVPSHALNRWRYHYPQVAFPYDDLIAENGRRGKFDPEYELLDTGVFDDDRYWIVEVDYVKAEADDVIMVVRVTNAGPDAATLHVLPTAWFRNTWSWDHGSPKPSLAARRRRRRPASTTRSVVSSSCWPGRGRTGRRRRRCSATTRPTSAGCSAPIPVRSIPKDGINDHVVRGDATVNPDRVGTKVSLWYRLEVGAGDSAELRLRLRPVGDAAREAVVGARRGRRPRRRPAPQGGRRVLRRADPARPLGGRGGDHAPGVRRHALEQAAVRLRRRSAGCGATRPSRSRRPRGCRGATRAGRTSTPSTSCRCPTSGSTRGSPPGTSASTASRWPTSTPAFAKYQLLLMCREWFQHPNGALPAYEWDFGDVNPPVQAWAALEVFAIDGARDVDFLSRVFDKLLVNFTWWVNLQDAYGSNLFEGGFLGLDNIGPIDRSHLPVGGTLEQSDATGWMAFYALAMATMATILNRSGQRPATDLVLKFLEHFADIRQAMDSSGVWDDADGLYYDKLVTPDGTAVPVKVRSMVGIIPLLAAVVLDEGVLDRAETLRQGVRPSARRARRPRGPHRAGAGARRAGTRPPAARRGRRRPHPEGAGPPVRRATSSCRPTACGPCRRTTVSTPTNSRSRESGRRSTTSRPSRRRRCSVATPTGGGRSGSR